MYGCQNPEYPYNIKRERFWRGKVLVAQFGLDNQSNAVNLNLREKIFGKSLLRLNVAVITNQPFSCASRFDHFEK